MGVAQVRIWRSRLQKSVLIAVAALQLATLAHAKPRISRQPFRFAGQQLPRTAFVQLFEWKWTDVAQECETFLGPYGFAAVQVSPPNEHALVRGTPWWERYQPVSYKIESHSGTRAEFMNMVKRCRAAGVDVYADTVINHTADNPPEGETRHGFAGTPYTNYRIAGLFEPWDFHNCGRYGDNSIRNYNDRWEVQNCNIYRTSDLNTGSDYVRQKLSDYLNDLLSIGVAGFRIDAAKHMAADDIAAILQRVRGSPYIVHEVIGNDDEPIKVGEYFSTGDVNEFKYARDLGRVFKDGKLAWLQNFGEAWRYMPSDKAVVFVTNHDTEREERSAYSALTYKDGQMYVLANIFMLAWPYGYPQLFSGYRFENFNQGPPMLGDGSIKPVYADGKPASCFKDWNCDHHYLPIARMVAFRNYTSPEFRVTKWWSDGENRIAFGRGGLGYVVINKSDQPLSQWFDTGLPAGEYCDIVSGVPSVSSAGGCTGAKFTVGANGWAQISVKPWDAVAIFGAAKAQ